MLRPVSATAPLPTVVSEAWSRGRPPLKRLSATTTPVTRAQSHGRVAERTYNGPLPRPPPLQGPQWNPRVSGLPEIGLFPVLRPVSATAPLPTVVSEAWSRVSAVNYRPSATSTPVTGICEASPRVRPSLNRSLFVYSTILCHGILDHKGLWGHPAWQAGRMLGFLTGPSD